MKLDITILLLLYVAILIALGTLGVARKAEFVFATKPDVQTTTPPDVKIDGLTTPPDLPPAKPQ